jgi:hypothetical protein
MIVKNSINANTFEKKYKIFTQPSKTVPDQSMSIKTILERYSRGLPVGGRLDEYYDEDDTLPNPLTLDLAERQELAELYTNEINEIKSRKKVINNVDKSVDNSEGDIQKNVETES